MSPLLPDSDLTRRPLFRRSIISVADILIRGLLIESALLLLRHWHRLWELPNCGVFHQSNFLRFPCQHSRIASQALSFVVRAGFIVQFGGRSIASFGVRIDGLVGCMSFRRVLGISSLEAALIDPRFIPELLGNAEWVDAG